MEYKKTVFFSFHGDIKVKSANNLIFNCDNAIKDGADHIYISFSSRGGLSDSGFHLHHTLKALKADITIHNTGSVESAGFTAFLAGNNRFSSENTRFLLHQPFRKFSANTSLDAREVSEFTQLLKNDELNIRNVIIQNTSATNAQVSRWFKMSKIFTPNEAAAVNIISEVREFTAPITHSLITIPTGD
jgi:ATP-dependent Clp protease protease subunit